MKFRIVKNLGSSSSAVAVAERAMPGWHAVEVLPTDGPTAPQRTNVVRGADIGQLRKKYIGTGHRSAKDDSLRSFGTGLPPGSGAGSNEMVTLERDSSEGSGPRLLTVIVSGDEVVAVQG